MNSLSLEETRKNFGAEKLHKSFEYSLKTNRNFAINQVNDKSLSFSTFFLIIPLIEKYNIANMLNIKNKIALKTYSQLFGKKQVFIEFDKEKEISVLKWIIESASYDDGIDDDYDRLIDYATAKLIDEYHDDEALNSAINLSFLRNSKGEYNHDLLWAIFKSGNPEIFKLIAKHLNSMNNKEADFSKDLLINATNGEITENDVSSFENYLVWIDENQPYMYSTGDGYNMSSSPDFYKIDSALKNYEKHKAQIPESKKPPKEIDKNYIDEFLNADKSIDSSIHNYSDLMFKTDKSKWKEPKVINPYKNIKSENQIKEV